MPTACCLCAGIVDAGAQQRDAQQVVSMALKMLLAMLGTGISRQFIVLPDPVYPNPPQSPYPPLPINGTLIGSDADAGMA